MFNLIKDEKQLASSNDGIAQASLMQFNASRDVTGNSFSNGRIVIPFSMSNTQWWVPSRSYLRARVSLTQSDGVTPLEMKDGIGPNMGLLPSLFSSCELQLNGVTVSRCNSMVPLLNQVENRLNKSEAFQDSVGAVNFNQNRLDERVNDVSGNGLIRSPPEIRYYDAFEIPDTATIATNQFTEIKDNVDFSELKATSVVITAAGPGADALTQDMANDINDFIRPGDFVVIGARGCKFQISNRATFAGGPGNGQITILASMAGDATNFVASNITVQASQVQFYKELVNSRRAPSFDVCWSPDVLSVFKEQGAFPGGGNYQLILNPHNNSGGNMEMRAIESYLSKTTADFKFVVNSMDYQCCVFNGRRIEDETYYMDLEESRAQILKLAASGSLSQSQFSISPTTTAITVGFQSTSAGTDTKFSPSRLRTVDKKELNLNRFFFKYASQTVPSPDASPEFVPGSIDYTGKLYMDAMLNSGKAFDQSGQETIQEWQQRGMMLHYKIPRDAQDRSTALTVSCSFSSAIDETNLVVIDHSRVVIRVVMEGGVVREVREMVL